MVNFTVLNVKSKQNKDLSKVFKETNNCLYLIFIVLLPFYNPYMPIPVPARRVHRICVVRAGGGEDDQKI